MATVTTTVNYKNDGREYKELPSGIQVWEANGVVVGAADSNDQQRLTVLFNPPSTRSFQPYVSVSHVSCLLESVPTTANAQVQTSGTDWERTPSGAATNIVAIVPMEITNNSTTRAGAFNGNIYLGRVELGSDGSLFISTNERLNSIFSVSLTGFISDRPFIPNFNWRS